jgi:hypothetical protein
MNKLQEFRNWVADTDAIATLIKKDGLTAKAHYGIADRNDRLEEKAV